MTMSESKSERRSSTRPVRHASLMHAIVSAALTIWHTLYNRIAILQPEDGEIKLPDALMRRIEADHKRNVSETNWLGPSKLQDRMRLSAAVLGLGPSCRRVIAESNAESIAMPYARFPVLLRLLACAAACCHRLDSIAAAGDSSAPQRPGTFVGTKAGDEREVAGMKLCWCPAGRFIMGSPPREPERRPGEDQVEVTLTKGFWMGKFEVTQGDWKRVVGKLPGELTVAAGKGEDFPVYNVNFAEAEGFCRKLTEIAHSAGDCPKDWEIRLPTEAQWEYACRGDHDRNGVRRSPEQQPGQFWRQTLQRSRAGTVAEAGNQGWQLPSQRLGALRHARKRGRVVPRLGTRKAPRRHRSRLVLGPQHGPTQSDGRFVAIPPGQRLDRQRLGISFGLPAAF